MAAAGPRGDVPPIADSAVVEHELMTIIKGKTQSEIRSLITHLSLAQQRGNMTIRNNYMSGAISEPIFPLLDAFKGIQKVKFEGGDDRNAIYPFTILSTRATTEYKYVTGGGYGQIYISDPAAAGAVGGAGAAAVGGAGGAGAAAVGGAGGAGGAPTILKLSKFQLVDSGQKIIDQLLPHIRGNLRPNLPNLLENEKVARDFFNELYIQVLLNVCVSTGERKRTSKSSIVSINTSLTSIITTKLTNISIAISNN
jgi:hypothetical protein